ncbi:hypothetical protein Mame01_23120 [Microbispora amethystogenes]|nr:hypothetical protein Mame01_23120 [Microbispora amethystogenes]
MVALVVIASSLLAEPAQDEDGLAERSQRPAAARGAQPPPVGGQQAGKELDGVARDVERGSIGDQGEASGSADDLVVRTVLPGASLLPAPRVPLCDLATHEHFTALAKIISLRNLTTSPGKAQSARS